MDCISYALVLFTIAVSVYSQCDISITQSPATTIPDDDLNGIQFNITAPAQPSGCVVDSLSVTLDATHTWVSDLHFSLNGFEFFGNQCGNLDDLAVTVSDSSSTPYGCPNGTADIQPISPFADEFGGDLLDVETIWTLSVYDEFGPDEGTLQSWALCITTYCPTTTTMAISTTTTTMAISSDSSSESAESDGSSSSSSSSDDVNSALFAGNQAVDNNNNELPEYGAYSLSLRFSDFALLNIWLFMCVICVVFAVIVCCFCHKNKTNCY